MRSFGWRKPFRTAWRWFTRSQRLLIVRGDELPEDLHEKTLYILGEGPHVWAVALRCPCGCQTVIHLNLLPGAKPRWRLTEHSNGSVTLHPSVWRQKGCRSHFFVRRGQIQWFVPEAATEQKSRSR